MGDELRTVLVRVSGRDRPGITAGLLAILADGGAEVFDMEQVITRHRLTLDMLVGLGAEHGVFKELLYFGWERGIQIDFEAIEVGDEEELGAGAPRHAVTVMAPRLDASALHGVASALAGAGANIDRITRLSRYPVVSYELVVSGGDATAMRRSLVEASREHQIDVALQPEILERRAKRLVLLDVDSTLIQDEVIDLLAAEAGRLDEVRAITRSAMEGETEFGDALTRRVALLEGLDLGSVERALSRVRLTPGARTFIRTLRRLGFTIAIVSGGFTIMTERLKADLGLDHAFGNELEIIDGRLTGRIVGPVIDRKRKGAILEEIAAAEGISVEQTVAVGDGANDLDMLAVAGLGIAFNAKPAVRDAADTAVSVPYLDAILFVLGIRRDDVERADRSDPGLDPDDPIPVAGTPPA